jgi:tRNA-binding protein
VDPVTAFKTIEIRAGRVTDVAEFPEARTPAYKLWIDFGQEIGTLQSSAQLTIRYTPEDLRGRQVLAVTNLGAKRVAGFKSECLVLGVELGGGDVALLSVDTVVPKGSRVS